MEALDDLDEHERNILNEYQTITHSNNIEQNIHILTHNNWDLKAAVRNQYTPTTASASTSTSTRPIYEQEAPSAELDSPSSTSSLLPNSNTTQQPSYPSTSSKRYRFLLSLVLWPFNIAWKVSWQVVLFTYRFIYNHYHASIGSNGGSASTRLYDPRFEADRFLRQFEFTFGTTHPVFFEGGYTQALSTAKKELQYLLVILCSEEHDDHENFCRETLTNPELLEFLHQHQVIVWGGNVRYPEAFQVSNTLQATTYPFLAIIALSSPSSPNTTGAPKMSVMDRIEGSTTATPASVIRRFESAMTRVGPTLHRLRHERDQRELERHLRQEQDAAYLESLRQDQEREQQREKERVEAARQKKKAALKEQKRVRWIRYWTQHYFVHEKRKEEEKERMAKISFRMANGDRVIQTFAANESLEALYRFVEVYPYIKDGQQQQEEDDERETDDLQDYEHEYKFTLHSPFPKTVFAADKEKTVGDEKGLWPSTTLIVDRVDSAEED